MKRPTHPNPLSRWGTIQSSGQIKRFRRAIFIFSWVTHRTFLTTRPTRLSCETLSFGRQADSGSGGGRDRPRVSTLFDRTVCLLGYLVEELLTCSIGRSHRLVPRNVTQEERASDEDHIHW